MNQYHINPPRRPHITHSSVSFPSCCELLRVIVSSDALEHYGQQLIEELTEEANVAADGSLFVQQLRRRRNESGGVPEEDDGPSSSALQAVQRTAGATNRRSFMSYGLSRYLRGMEACMCACVIKDAISCPCPITANCSPAVAAFTGDGRWMAHCNQSQCDPSPTLCRLQFYLTLCTLGAGGCFLCWQSPIPPLPMSVNGIVAELFH